MGELAKSTADVIEIQPPDMVPLTDGNAALLTPVQSHMIDVRYLLPPLEIISRAPDMEIPPQARKLRDAYIDLSHVSFEAIWHETETFVASAAEDNQITLSNDTLFYTHLAFDELMQNAFRHGGQPLRVWTSLVMANEVSPNDAVAANRRIVPGVPLQPASMTSQRVLLGVQDSNPRWNERTGNTGDALSENFRGLDLVRGVSRALWHRQDDEAASKWVWALI